MQEIKAEDVFGTFDHVLDNGQHRIAGQHRDGYMVLWNWTSGKFYAFASEAACNANGWEVNKEAVRRGRERQPAQATGEGPVPHRNESWPAWKPRP